MNLTLGLLLVVIAGAMEGLFSLGVTRTPKWAWENTWGLGSLIALVCVPWPLVFLTVPNYLKIFAEVGTGKVLIVFLLGIGWGFGGIFWGKAIAAVGVALGVSLLMGFINVFGGPTPLWIFSPEKSGSQAAIALYIAVAVMLIGIAIISMAGKQKETDLAAAKGTTNQHIAAGARTPFLIGLLFCLISGALSASVNLGLVYGNQIGHIGDIADKYGTPSWASNFVIWAVVFTGNYGVNFIYALLMMLKNKNMSRLFTAGGASHWFWAFFLGLCWPIGIIVFGIGAGYMGKLGAYAGFPMMLLCAVLFGNLAGALQGEWNGAGKRAKSMMMLGVATLLIAFGILGYSNMLP